LKDQVFEQPPDRIIGKRCHHGCIKAEAAFQSTRDVIFATALIDVEVSGGPNPVIARIKP
jgi:hypothetical protein